MTAPAALASEGRFVLVINGRIEVKVRSLAATVSLRSAEGVSDVRLRTRGTA